MYTIVYRSILWPLYDDDDEIWIPNFSNSKTFDPFFFFVSQLVDNNNNNNNEHL